MNIGENNLCILFGFIFLVLEAKSAFPKSVIRNQRDHRRSLFRG
jgi:hypothetical protein